MIYPPEDSNNQSNSCHKLYNLLWVLYQPWGSNHGITLKSRLLKYSSINALGRASTARLMDVSTQAGHVRHRHQVVSISRLYPISILSLLPLGRGGRVLECGSPLNSGRSPPRGALMAAKLSIYQAVSCYIIYIHWILLTFPFITKR